MKKIRKFGRKWFYRLGYYVLILNREIEWLLERWQFLTSISWQVRNDIEKVPCRAERRREREEDRKEFKEIQRELASS